MTQNVTQWLDEIKTLKQQLAEAQREREEAYTSAANWQRLYETEAQQRRIEANLARQSIESLHREMEQLQTRFGPQRSASVTTELIQTEVEQVTSEVDLRSRLAAALAECDRLKTALQTEQENHVQTRKSLTMALGDAINALKAREPGESC